MVLYFSGTGNSRYVAQRIADSLGTALLNMNVLIKSGDSSPVMTNENLVIVTPTYAWRIPRPVESWLHQTEFPGARQVWFVMTCGSKIGNAAKYNHALCQEKQLVYMGTAQIIMPENYLAMFNTPQEEEARQIVAKAEPDIDRAAASIAAAQAFQTPRSSVHDRFMSGPVNPIFYSLFVKAKAFTTDDRCTSCGQCAKVCPTNNITLKDGRPVWDSNCTHCMACICRCPAEAIEYGRKSVGKPRYQFRDL